MKNISLASEEVKTEVAFPKVISASWLTRFLGISHGGLLKHRTEAFKSFEPYRSAALKRNANYREKLAEFEKGTLYKEPQPDTPPFSPLEAVILIVSVRAIREYRTIERTYTEIVGAPTGLIQKYAQEFIPSRTTGEN